MKSFTRYLYISFYISFTGLLSVSAIAGEISLQHRGLTLNAQLELATGQTIADNIILITHGALAHRGMETIRYLQTLLKERQYSTLAINLSLGLNNRRGMYDCNQTHRHRNEDAVDEISAWLAWLKSKGTQQVTLLGHSRGGAQTALYSAENTNPLVNTIVLLAPATAGNTSVAAYSKRYNLSLNPLLKKAKQLVDKNRGDTVLKHIGLLSCRDTSATAQTILSYYGQDSKVNTINLIDNLKIPILVVVAGDDRIVTDLVDQMKTILPHRHVQMEIVDGADHMFRDLFADEAVDTIHTFLQYSQKQLTHKGNHIYDIR